MTTYTRPAGRTPTRRVVQFSGGVGSWATAKLVRERYPDDELVCLFADTRMEDPDLYRFITQAADNVGGELVTLTEGRTPWEVFKDKRFIGNTRLDPCSYYLKRLPLRAWLEEHCDPEHTTVYLGIDWGEAHRFDRALAYWAPWTVRAPLIERPELDKLTMLAWLEREGIAAPRLYAMGFPHNNCGGFCIKAGQGHFKLLLEQLPERYAEHEVAEQELRDYLDKDVSILRDRTGGVTRPMTLTVLRQRVEDGAAVDEYDIGGCNCVNPDLTADRELESLSADPT